MWVIHQDPMLGVPSTGFFLPSIVGGHDSRSHDSLIGMLHMCEKMGDIRVRAKRGWTDAQVSIGRDSIVIGREIAPCDTDLCIGTKYTPAQLFEQLHGAQSALNERRDTVLSYLGSEIDGAPAQSPGQSGERHDDVRPHHDGKTAYYRENGVLLKVLILMDKDSVTIEYAIDGFHDIKSSDGDTIEFTANVDIYYLCTADPMRAILRSQSGGSLEFQLTLASTNGLSAAIYDDLHRGRVDAPSSDEHPCVLRTSGLSDEGSSAVTHGGNPLIRSEKSGVPEEGAVNPNDNIQVIRAQSMIRRSHKAYWKMYFDSDNIDMMSKEEAVERKKKTRRLGEDHRCCACSNTVSVCICRYPLLPVPLCISEYMNKSRKCWLAQRMCVIGSMPKSHTISSIDMHTYSLLGRADSSNEHDCDTNAFLVGAGAPPIVMTDSPGYESETTSTSCLTTCPGRDVCEGQCDSPPSDSTSENPLCSSSLVPVWPSAT